MIAGERRHGFDFPVIVDSHHIPGMDDPSVPEADAAVAPVDRTVRTQTDAIIEDKTTMKKILVRIAMSLFWRFMRYLVIT